MKYLKLFIAFILYQPLVGQNLPDINSLLSIQPKWNYVSEDTNWYRIQFDNNPHFDQYFGTFYHNSMIKDGDYYLLESGIGQTHTPPLSEGYFLHKIDLNTGIPEWIHYDNFYSGNDLVETVFGGNMHFNQDGNIVVNGFKSLDSIKNITFEGFDDRVYVNVMQDVIDNNSGHLINHRVNLDTSRTIDKLHPGGFGIKKVGNNRQIKHKFENVFEDGLVRNYLHFYDIDEGGIISDTPVFSYKHTTIVDFNAPFLSFPNIYLQINETKGVALFGSRDQAQGNIPVELKLVFFDTSNSPNIVNTEERDILHLLPEDLDKSSGYPTIRNKDGYFYIGQKARVPLNSTEEELYIWLQFYDSNGIPFQKIDRLEVDDFNIDLLSDYTIVDSTIYLLCNVFDGSPLQEDKYYLIKSKKDSNLEKLSSFVKPLAFNNYDIVFSGMQILEDYDVMLYFNINYPYNGFGKKNASFLCRYDGNDFGLTTTVIQEEETDKTAFVSPNPATDYISLNTTNNQTISNVSIIDVLSNSRPYNTSSENQLDVSDLMPGNYFVQYHQNGKLVVLPFVKM